jgi:hypothetical protein
MVCVAKDGRVTGAGSAMMFRRFVGILVFAFVISSDALSQQSFQDLEAASQFDRALAAVDQIKHRKKLQCLLDIVNRSLCECLSRSLPLDTYVGSFTAITNQESEYAQLSATDKVIVDRCVRDSR